jgi:hypothetical protein
LDGTTAAPTFSSDLHSPNYVAPDAEGIYTFTVTNLGRIEIGFLGGFAMGNRLLTNLWVFSPLPPATFLLIDVADRTYGFRLGRIAQLTVGTFFRRSIAIPQASRLILDGDFESGRVAGSPPIVIRFNVVVPAVEFQFADADRAHMRYPVA